MNIPIVQAKPVHFKGECNNNFDTRFVAKYQANGEFKGFECIECGMCGGNIGNLNVHKYNCNNNTFEHYVYNYFNKHQ